jgi:RHS repeat-associated protein
LAVYDGYNNLLQRFEYADGRMPVAMTAGGSTYYLAYDQVGSIRLVTDSGGNIVKRIDYDSFGNILTDSNENFTIPFGFAGGLHDRDTGLVRFGYRDFLPEIGKWTAKDPILFAGGDSNLYVYVANDPVNWVDPEGLSFNGGLGYGGTIVIGWGDFCFGGSLSFSFNVADDGSFAAQVNIIKFDKVYGGYAGIGRSINGGLSIDNPNTGINSYHDQPAVATGAGRGPSGEVSVVLGQDDNGGGFIGAAGSGRAGQGYGAYYGEGKAMGVEVRRKLWE